VWERVDVRRRRDTITASGINNRITFRAGSPQINNGGVSNIVRPG
jgi:hypothetical protein